MFPLASLLESSTPLIMGILNITPDSFSDGGKFFTEYHIAAQVNKILEEGADVIDVGGESTRPFASPVSLNEELRRVLPAIGIIRKYCSMPISIDTRKAEVARQAINNGADIINDISALRSDPEMVSVVRESKSPVVLMHMQGAPDDMQHNPTYINVVSEIMEFLKQRVLWAQGQGIPKEQLIVDPGIGFGKTVSHNLSILKELDKFRTLHIPLLIGHSRKSFIGKILDHAVDDRDLATAVISAYCMLHRVAIVRVHEVGKTRQAFRLIRAIAEAP